MTASTLDYLADRYRLEELEDWRLLARHLELVEGFSFVVVLAPDDEAIAYVRSRLPEIVGTSEAVQHLAFDPSAGAGSLSEALLTVSVPESVRLLWIDANPVDPEQIPARDKAWRDVLSRLNRYRNNLQSRFHCTLALAGAVSLQTILREAAPDLWSIRSGVFRIEPVGSARRLEQSIRRSREDHVIFVGIELPGDPAETLAEAQKIRDKPGREILLAQLLRQAGRQAFRQLQWDLALKCLQEAYALEEAHGGDPELRFHIANEIAVVFQRLAQWDRALYYSRKALNIAEGHFGENDLLTADALNNQAQLLQDTNRLAEAEPMMRRALAIDERNLGADNPEVAIALSNLASLLQDMKQLSEAVSLMRRALAIDDASLGPDHPNVAIHLNNLAQLLQDMNQLAEAEPISRRALAIHEKSFGPDHPNVAISLNNLAGLLMVTNRLAEAEPLMRRALAIDERSFGPDHPDVAVRLNNLARLLEATNRLTEAEPLDRQALKIYHDFTLRTGYDHPHLQTAMANFRGIMVALGRSQAEIQSEIEKVTGEMV